MPPLPGPLLHLSKWRRGSWALAVIVRFRGSMRDHRFGEFSPGGEGIGEDERNLFPQGLNLDLNHAFKFLGKTD